MNALSRPPSARLAYATLAVVITVAVSPILAALTVRAPEVAWLFESLSEAQTAPHVTPVLQAIGCIALVRIAVAR